MGDRFEGLKKIPKEPAQRLLALANAKLSVKLASPAAAPVGTVLAELDEAGAKVDMLRLLAAALPPREAIWWACLAGEDCVRDREAGLPRALQAAEAWVFKPGDETREAARVAAEQADVDDDTALCATAVTMSDGKLGTGDLAQFEAPPGAAAAAVFGMNAVSLGTAAPESFEAHFDLLIDRALDIARGGNGRIDPSGRSETSAGAEMGVPEQ